MESSQDKIIRVSDLIGKNEDLLKSGHRYGEFRCYYKDHEHDEDFDSMVSVDNSSIFRLGEQFPSYEGLLDRLDEHSKMSYIHYWRRDSRTVDGAHMKTSRPISSNLKYYSVKFACIYGGQRFLSRAKGKRASISRRTNCPSHITVRANKCGQSLEVISVCNHHNHPISRDIYHRMPHDRRLPSQVKEDVLDLLRLGFNQKRVREYIEWETGKKLANKDLHNLVAIDKRPKILISEKRALHLEQILAIFEANKTHSSVIRLRTKKSNQKRRAVSAENDIGATNPSVQIKCEDGDHSSDNGVEPYTYIEETFDVSNEIEVSLEEGISIEGNYFFQNNVSPGEDIATLTVINRDDYKEGLEILNENGNINEVIIGEYDSSFETINEKADNQNNNGECANNIIIVSQKNSEVNLDKGGSVSENDDMTNVCKKKIVNNEDIDEITEVNIDKHEEVEVAVEVEIKIDQDFSEDEVPLDEVYEQPPTPNADSDYVEVCCETCGRLHADIYFDVRKLKSERDELLKETALLREEKVRLIKELLCLKDTKNIQNDGNENVNSSEGNVWIVVE